MVNIKGLFVVVLMVIGSSLKASGAGPQCRSLFPMQLEGWVGEITEKIQHYETEGVFKPFRRYLREKNRKIGNERDQYILRASKIDKLMIINRIEKAYGTMSIGLLAETLLFLRRYEFPLDGAPMKNWEAVFYGQLRKATEVDSYGVLSKTLNTYEYLDSPMGQPEFNEIIRALTQTKFKISPTLSQLDIILNRISRQPYEITDSKLLPEAEKMALAIFRETLDKAFQGENFNRVQVLSIILSLFRLGLKNSAEISRVWEDFKSFYTMNLTKHEVYLVDQVIGKLE
jgi:hypothetical protein